MHPKIGPQLYSDILKIILEHSINCLHACDTSSITGLRFRLMQGFQARTRFCFFDTSMKRPHYSWLLIPKKSCSNAWELSFNNQQDPRQSVTCLNAYSDAFRSPYLPKDLSCMIDQDRKESAYYSNHQWSNLLLTNLPYRQCREITFLWQSSSLQWS